MFSLYWLVIAGGIVLWTIVGVAAR